MAGRLAMALSKSELRPLAELGRGGFGVVYRTRAAIDGGMLRDVAYKELLPPKLGKEDDVNWNKRAIRESVNFRHHLSDADRATLDRISVWPLEIVHDGGQITGYVMNLIEPEFMLQSNVGPRLATVGWLAARESTLKASGVDAAPFRHFQVRLSLMTQLAYCVAWLHRRGRVFGDLSLTNGAFVSAPTRYLLTDCDATARLRDSRRRQAHSPFFDPPEGGNLQTFASDVYKLALCVVRALSIGRGATQVRTTRQLEQQLPVELVWLLDLALGRKPEKRPSAKDLWGALNDHLDRAYPQPRIEFVTSSPTGPLLRGQDLVVRWRCIQADEVSITGPDGQTVTFAGAVGSTALRIDRAGDVRIRASNVNGYTDAHVREVGVYEIGALKWARIEAPRMALPIGFRPEIRLPEVSIPTIPGGASLTPMHPPTAATDIHRDLAQISQATQDLGWVLGEGVRTHNHLLRGALRGGMTAHNDALSQAMRAATAGMRDASSTNGSEPNAKRP